MAYAFAARQTASGIRYADVIVNPTHWNAWRGREIELLSALSEGFDEAAQDGLCETGIAYSLLRSQTAREAEDIVAALTYQRPDRVIALSVDGDEKVTGRTGEKFQTAFARAAAPSTPASRVALPGCGMRSISSRPSASTTVCARSRIRR